MAKNARSSLAHRLYSGEVSYDFVGHRKRWYLISAVLLVACLAFIGLRGLNLSIDFTGGSEFNVPTPVTATTVDEYRTVAQDTDLPDLGEVRVNTIGDDQVRVQTRALNAEEINQMTAALAEHAGVDTTEVTNNLIGSSWGQQITQQGLIALVVFLVLVALMIWAYFRNWKMSVAALIALAHDLIVVIGVYALLQFTFSPASLIGTLTILGYSLYDTVVVFDRVRDNLREVKGSDRTLAQWVNLAVNQVLIRSLNTTIIGVLPVAALLFTGTFILGTGPLMDLGLALFVGMIAGAYSSIFLAAPLFVELRQRDADMVEHEARLERRRARKSERASRVGADADEPATQQPVGYATALSGASAVDPRTLGAVRPDELRPEQMGPRTQPKRTTRSQRRQDQP
ncbi:protein translocase subunit SecF [Propioniciclava soli]|uniref:Protein-export membrane protein SecF n=1 Tax=Propioniciclava soli TaxID=2775081 RepID=A0ABZ3C2D3_9ACTN|nr:protein translocase subunit SecF [Propioniciclava soli]